MFATAEGTKSYADRMWANNPRLSPDSWRQLEGLTVAKIGIGTAKLDGRSQQPQALEEALLSGCNLIDTGPMFMATMAEVFVGQTLQTLFNAQALTRTEVVVLTKGALLPPFNHENLFTQYEQSCQRLALVPDGYILHQIEDLFKHHLNTLSKDEAETRFYQDLTTAFTLLEELCQQEKLQFYGISSVTITHPKESHGFIDLAKVFAAAQSAAQAAWGRRKRPQFRVLQCPLNLLETGVIFNINTTAKTFMAEEATPTLELASRMHLSVLAYSPLKATPTTQHKSPLRLTDGAKIHNLTPLLAALRQVEEKTGLTEAPPSPTEPPLLSDTMAAHSPHLTTPTLEEAYGTIFTPLLLHHAHTLSHKGVQQEVLNDLAQHFMATYTAMAENARHREETPTTPLRDIIRAAANTPHTPLTNTPFAQVALNAIASTPGVTSVLCGLRHPHHVADVRCVLEGGDVADVAPLFAHRNF